MSTAAAVERAVLDIVVARGEIDNRFTELVQLLRSAAEALEHGGNVDAARLLTEAADIEFELLGEAEIVGALQNALGLVDGTEARLAAKVAAHGG